MFRFVSSLTLPLLVALPAFAASIGSGAPSAQVEQSFVNAYNRGQFPLLVALPPLNDVHSLGSPGLVQEFSPKSGGNAKYALVKPDPTALVSQTDTLQIYSDLYAFYTSTGVSTAGYPTIDTTACPTNTMGTCNYQLFTKNYALFVYSTPTVSLAVRDPFYTAWVNVGGVSGIPGPALTAETAVTSPSKVQATQQNFSGASIFAYPVGSTTPVVHTIVDPLNSVFNNAGGVATLGLPTSEAVTIPATGLIRQTFEYGRIEQPAGGTANVLFALSEVDITYVSLGLTLNAGASATISATTLDIRGFQVNDRTINWTSTNGAVVKVTGNGYSAVVQAVGGGSASVYATAEGKTSAPLLVRVGSVCCGIGEGAPAPAITQAFQAAVMRNNLSVTLPASSPVTRQGTGYIQALTAADGSGTAYVIAQADNSSSAWVLSGNIYAAYLANGGFTGPLGYPASDPLSGGIQKFTSGAALAGNPVRVIPAIIAAKWFQAGGIAGAPGPPVADPLPFSSFSGVSGVSQAFQGGAIFGINSGSSAGQAFFSTGLILSRYQALSGPGGALGIPTSDVFPSGAALQENFETGYIDLQPAASSAVEHFNPRHPVISLTPSIVVPGGRVHISATGFAPGSTLVFSITGQPGFSVQSAAGAYAWDAVIPANAKSATVAVQVSVKAGTDVAAASYTISSVPALLPKFTLVSGDHQTGAPGSTLPLAITAVLLDSTGAPIAGVPVSGTASPGASLASSFVTDANGRIAVSFRLPPSTGVAVGSLSAGGQVVEFSALGAAKTIQAFPAFTQPDPQGGLVASLAALLRYYQNAGTLPSPNGSATPAALTQYLTANHGYSPSESGKSIPNPWIAAQFASAGLFLDTPSLARAVDLAGSGTPLVLVLNLTLDGVPAGFTVVDAIGVNADVSIAIADPNPDYARSSLADYLNGFTSGGHLVRATLSAILRIGPLQLPPGAAPFVVATPISAGAAANSPLGSCATINLQDGPGGVRYQYCDGTQPAYELDLIAAKAGSVVDLTGRVPLALPSNGTLSWLITRSAGALTSSAQTISIAAVTDSAAFQKLLAPGSLVTVFGSGFTGSPAVTIAGKAAAVLAAFPFQINALIPPEIGLGNATLQVAGSLGTASTTIMISPLAPGIFLIGANSQGAIVNLPDGSINSPSLPAQRGQYISVYAAGLGATSFRNGFQTANTPVMVVMNSASVPASFAGLVPGFVGLYQINVQVPATLPPSLFATLSLQQGSQSSNSVALSID